MDQFKLKAREVEGPVSLAMIEVLSSADVLDPLRRLWCKVTLQSRLVLELQTIDSQAHIGKNRGPRLSKSEGSGHLLVQVFCKKKNPTKRLKEIGG